MRNSSLLFIALLSLIITSCHQEKVLGDNELPDLAKAQSLIPVDSIDLESLDILNPHTIWFNDDFLCFHVGDGEQEMHFLDLRKMNVVERNIYGPGPNQVSRFERMPSSSKSEFKLMDIDSWDFYSINLDSLRSNPDTEPVWLYKMPKKRGIAFIPGAIEVGRYVYFTGVYTSGEGWIYCYDKHTQEFKAYGEFPAYDELGSEEYMTKSMVFEVMAKATNGERLMLCHFGTLDFYDITENGGLQVFREHHYYLPKIVVYPNGTFAYSSQAKSGFFPTVASDTQYIYLLYSDKNLKENLERNSEYLFVYDWDGNPVKQYSLEKPLYDLSVNGTTLYGLSREVEPIVYIYDLKDLHKK